jgi:hypothetical protein
LTRQIFLTGLRRSGLHACINSLMGHFPGEACLINDPCFENQNLERYRYSYEVTESAIRELVTENFLRKRAIKQNFSAVNRLPWPLAGAGRRFMDWCWKKQIEASPVDWPSLIAGPKTEPDTRIILIENSSIQDYAREMPAWLKRQNWTPGGVVPKEKEVGIILRSPWNCLASNLRFKFKHIAPREIPHKAIKDAWKDLAREALGQTKTPEKAGFTPRCLVYHHYFASRDSREEVAARFGVPVNETAIKIIASFGSGSSFDGMNLTGEIRKTSARWKQSEEHPLMKEMRADAKLMSLAAHLGLKIEHN